MTPKDSAPEASLIQKYVQVALSRWKFIATVTFGVAILSAGISLLLPNWYRAESRLLPSENSGGSAVAAAMLRSLPSAASSIIGSPSDGDYSRYLSIITSRGVLDGAVRDFDLVQVYETVDSPAPELYARRELLQNLDIKIDEEFGFLTVGVYDRDPQRAADVVNFLVREMSRRNSQLATENATSYRSYVEDRYLTSMARLDSLLLETQRFQEENGVVDLPTQAQAYFEQMGALRAGALRAEIEYESLREQLGEDNPRVRSLASLARSADQKYLDASQGAELTMPVAVRELPQVLRRYVELERDRLILSRVIEVLGPMLEQARFDEERESQSVQVVDYAIPPDEKAKPFRSLIVISSAFAACVLAILYLILLDWYPRTKHVVVRRKPSSNPALQEQV